MESKGAEALVVGVTSDFRPLSAVRPTLDLPGWLTVASVSTAVDVAVSVPSTLVVATPVVVVAVFTNTVTAARVFAAAVIVSRLIVINGTVTTVLQAIVTNVVICIISAVLIVVDRAIAAQFHAVCVEVIR